MLTHISTGFLQQTFDLNDQLGTFDCNIVFQMNKLKKAKIVLSHLLLLASWVIFGVFFAIIGFPEIHGENMLTDLKREMNEPLAHFYVPISMNEPIQV